MTALSLSQLEPAPRIELAAVRAVLFDIDGVLARGETAQPYAAELVELLAERGIAAACVTNNSCLTPESQAENFQALGIDLPADRIITSAHAARRHLDEVAPAGSRLLAVGMSGLRTALFADGVFVEDEDEPDFVVVGLDLDFDYAKARRAVRALLDGAGFIGTNADAMRPVGNRVEPEAGALLAFLQAATGIAPHVVGKPRPKMFELALERLGVSPADALVVGDNLDTDIAGAEAASLASVLVMNGVTTSQVLHAHRLHPSWVVDDLRELLTVGA